MIESAFSILLQIAATYAVAGIVTAVWFFVRRIKRLNPSAAGGSLGFRVLVTPGIIALWPLILMKAVRPGSGACPDRAEELRRNHRTAIFILAAAGLLAFATALIWRAPAFNSLPETETTRP
jgi:hypothetical protein